MSQYGCWEAERELLFSLVPSFLFFQQEVEISLMVNAGIKGVRSFACISSTKNHYFLCRKHKNVPKHKNNHRHADPSTSCFSFRYFAMWRILTRSRFLLPPQPTEEMLVFAEETPKVGGHREGIGTISGPVCLVLTCLLTRQFWVISGHFWRVHI